MGNPERTVDLVRTGKARFTATNVRGGTIEIGDGVDDDAFTPIELLLAALGGSAAIFAFGSPDQPVVGASGAIFGLFAACLVMVRRLGLDPQWLIAVIVLNFVFTFSVADISKLGHVGGFVVGGLAGLSIAGLPSHRGRIPSSTQLSGLGGVLVLIVVVVLVRAATGANSL